MKQKHQIIFFNAMFILVGLLMLSGCKKEGEVPASIETKFIVDKIYDYNNDLVAEYFYDNENKLIKKSVTEHLGHNYHTEWSAYTDDFEYQNGLVSKIIHKDITYNTYNYETHIFYDSQKKLIKTEVYKNGRQISSNSGYRYENGRLVGIWNYNDESYVYTDTIVYDRSGNVSSYIFVRPETNPIGEPIPGTRRISVQYFNYDDQLRPDFGLGYLFIYEPLPFREEADLQRQLSANNMTAFIGGGSKWIYSYNENGLPSTIEVKWKDSETTEPVLLRIKYKEIY